MFDGTNLGVGVTPNAWTLTTPIQINAYGCYIAAGISQSGMYVGSNNYYNAGWKYTTTGPVTQFKQNESGTGAFAWNTAPSGTAGNAITFTQAMTLFATNNFAVGTTTDYGDRLVAGVATSATLAAGDNGISVRNVGESNQIRMSRLGSTYNYLGVTGPGGMVYSYDKLSFAADTSNPITFHTGGSERARFDSSGNLLVGTTSGGARVYAVASGSQQAIRGDQSTAGAAAIYCTSSVNSGTGYVAYFTNSGSGTGLYISNTAAWQSTSDERLKTDIKDLDTTVRLMQLRPRDYLWKSQETSDNPTKRNFGFIAQEVQQIFPELVGVSPNEMLSVEYTGLIAPLIKAIQEQQALITQLTTRLTALENK